MNETPLVSIICNTYNQSKYIRTTLDSFLMQKTTFPFEILLHDDASTDGTSDIVREYAEKYPDIVRPIIQKENQYSKGTCITSAFQYPRARGKYIAFCEGDDYWTDPMKLQKQFEVLESMPDVDMCTHASVAVRDKEICYRIEPSDKDTLFSQDEVILGGASFVATNSLFYRKSMVEPLPEFLKIYHLDFFMQIAGSLRGGMYYLKDNMSAYRVFAESSWSLTTAYDDKVTEEHETKMIRAFKELDEDTHGKYHESIQRRMYESEFDLLQIKGGLKCLDGKYKFIRKRMNLSSRIKLWGRVLFPFLIPVVHKYKRKRIQRKNERNRI